MIQMLSDEMKEQYVKFISPMPDKGRLLETGTGFGHSALFFASLKPSWTIYTVDGYSLYGDGRIYSKWEPEVIKAVNKSFIGKNIIQILADSPTVAWELPLDVLYIDADHTYQGCRADYMNYGAHVKEGGLIIFDDYEKHNSINQVSEFVDSIAYMELLYKGRAAIFRK